MKLLNGNYLLCKNELLHNSYTSSTISLFFNYSTVFPKMVGSIEFSPPLLPKNQTNQYVKVKNISTVFSFCILIGKSFNGNWLYYREIRGRNFICIVSGAYHGQTKQQDLLFDFVKYRISDIKMTFFNLSPFAKELICHTCLKLYFSAMDFKALIWARVKVQQLLAS